MRLINRAKLFRTTPSLDWFADDRVADLAQTSVAKASLEGKGGAFSFRGVLWPATSRHYDFASIEYCQFARIDR
jgi:hypothetical protein